MLTYVECQVSPIRYIYTLLFVVILLHWLCCFQIHVTWRLLIWVTTLNPVKIAFKAVVCINVRVCVCSTVQFIRWLNILCALCANSYSALKYKGRRLSDFAYAGEPIPESKLSARCVIANHIACTSFSLPYFTLGKLLITIIVIISIFLHFGAVSPGT